MIKKGVSEKEFAQMVEKEITDVRNGITKYQRDYYKLALLAATVCIMTQKRPIALWKECIVQWNKDKSRAVTAFLERLARNVIFTATVPKSKLIEKDLARSLTDYWTDPDILDYLTLANDDMRKMLQGWSGFWLDDKQTGFANIPEQYRTAALQGDFGGLIARKLAAAVEDSTATKKEPQRAGNEPTEQTQHKPQPQDALPIWQAWKKAGTRNIFAVVEERAFLEMVQNADFTSVPIYKNKTALKYTIYRISILYGGQQWRQQCYINLKAKHRDWGNENPDNWHKRKGQSQTINEIFP